MRLVVLVAGLHQKLLLHPVGKLFQSWVKCVGDFIDRSFIYTHLPQLHTSVAHLVHHIDVHQVALRQLKRLLFFAVLPLYRHPRLFPCLLGQLVFLADEVGHTLDLAAVYLRHFIVKYLILGSCSAYLFLT